MTVVCVSDIFTKEFETVILKKKMFECTCYLNGCSVRQRTLSNGFPKKLLVATSVVVIITMCLIPAEARTIEGVKIRHGRHEAANPKDARLRVPEARVIEHKRLSHRKQTLSSMHYAKDTMDPRRPQRNAQAERFKNATKKIQKQLQNTWRFFFEDRVVLNETKEYRDGMPSWLPAINFVDIHFYNYRKQRRFGRTMPEKKFMYLMPKLYKSLMEYQDIFKLLLNVEVELPDDLFYVYNKTRQELIRKTLYNLSNTIAEIKDNMELVNMPIPQLNPNKHLNTLPPRVNAPQCLKNDYIAFRAYGNLLDNWHLEFKCPKSKKVVSATSKPNCAAFEAKLKQKRASRTPKTKVSRKPIS